MRTIPIVYKSFRRDTPSRGFWDHTILEIVTDKDRLAVAGIEIREYEDVLPAGEDGIILVIPGRSHGDLVEEVNKAISPYKWVLIIITGDEESVFPVDALQHSNMKVWVMTPQPGKYQKIDRIIPDGPTPHTMPASGEKIQEDRTYTMSFVGQNTHQRRAEAVDAISTANEEHHKYLCVPTEGFTQEGITRAEYAQSLVDSKTVACPSGAVIPDSFRIYEALESGCAVILDGKAPDGRFHNYFDFLLGEHPFVQIQDWHDSIGYAENYAERYPVVNNEHFAWWQRYKRQLAIWLCEDLEEIGAYTPTPTWKPEENITVLIPTSPIPSHPSTHVIEETIRSITDRIPGAEILIMIDGVREEQEDRRADYEVYKERLLWLCNTEFRNVTPIVFNEHLHQAEMTRRTLDLVRTRNILFVEHDTPLCEEIPFVQIVRALETETVDLVRFNHEALILPDHEHLVVERGGIGWLPLVFTAQWSQRPHIAKTEFYKDVLRKHFSDESRTMIEDTMHGVVAEGYRLRGRAFWNDYKLAIYAPEGDMKRSYHLDGRDGESKYSMKK